MKRLLMILAVLVPLRLDAAATAATAAEEPVGHPRIRVTAPSLSGKRLVGVFVSLDETTLRIEREEGQPPIAVPRASITKLETSRHGSRKAQGAGLGALFGFATALLIGQAAGEDCPKLPLDHYENWFQSFCVNKSELTLASAVLTVPAGLLVGILAAPGEKWDVVNADRLRITVTRDRQGVGGALAIRF